MSEGEDRTQKFEPDAPKDSLPSQGSSASKQQPAVEPPDRDETLTVAFTPELLQQIDAAVPGDSLLSTDFEIAPNLLGNGSSSDIPLVLGEYVIESFLGRGGMGHVYRARHRMMDRIVALKVLPADFADNQELVDRFFLEVKSLGRLLHPNIVTAFDAGRANSLYYLVMELIEGLSLSARVDSQGPFSPSESVDIVMQAATALEYAHARGMIHRDIKPSNIMLTNAGQVKILDFGLVRLAGEHDELLADQRRNLMGTVEYMSPEQIKNSADVDQRADLYALGATLFFMLTGEPMFVGEPVQIALAHLNESPPVLYEVRGDVDLRIDALFQRLIAKNRDDRFASATEVLKYLQDSNLAKLAAERLPSTVSVTRELNRVLRDNPTRGFSQRSTARREFNAIGIAIDNSGARSCYVDQSLRVVPIQLDDSEFELPGVIWSNAELLLFGRLAANAGRKYPENLHTDLLWPLYRKPNRYHVCGRECPAEVLLAAFVHRIVQTATITARDVTHTVLAVPSCLTQKDRAAIVTSCRIAGVEVLQLLDSHLAAALAIRVRDAEQAKEESSSNLPLSGEMLVVTMGDEYAEAAVVNCHERKVQTIFAQSDLRLGLRRWQQKLREQFIKSIDRSVAAAIQKDASISSRVDTVISKLMRSLFASNRAIARLSVGNERVEWVVSQLQMFEWLATDLAQFESLIKSTIERSGVDARKIHSLLLIGDTWDASAFTKILDRCCEPSIRRVYAGASEIARGAAMQATFLIPPGIPNGYSAIAASSVDIGVTLATARTPVTEPHVLVSAGTALPATHSRTLRLDRSESDAWKLLFAERATNSVPWSALTSCDVRENLPQLERRAPLQLRLRGDRSGLWTATLHDLQHNQQITVPLVSGLELNARELQDWQQWLETTILCAVQRLP